MLKSLQQFPPEGWQFYQPETNWRPNSWMDFKNVVQQIITHRQANPRFKLATDVERVSQELVAYTEARLKSTYGERADQWIIPSGDGSPPPPFSLPLRQHQAGGAAVVGSLAKKFAGVGVVLDWLGDGLQPVSQDAANKRAVVCENCPHNKVDPSLVDLVASGLHALMEARAEMKLETPFDQKLNTCEICSCVLKLKVWTPIDHIKAKTKAEIMNKLPGFCWIKSS